MKKIILISISILSLTSCVSLRKFASFHDPYENVKLTKKYEKVEKKEIKEIKEVIEINKKEDIVKNIENKYEFKEFTKAELDILSAFKDTYKLVESKSDIERKTREAVILINVKNKKSISNIEFIKSINEVLKATKTKSYTSAISRTINNLEK